jgi:hypothetical protein
MNDLIITNQNVFKVMKLVMESAKKFYFKNPNIKGFIFSFTGDKVKNSQRLSLYKRYIGDFGELELKDNIYYLKINK